MRAKADLFGHVSEGALAIEAAGLFGRRGIVGSLRRNGSDGARNWRLARSA